MSDIPTVIVLIGPPLSGKDTFLKNSIYKDYTIVCRDDIVLELSNTKNYNDAFKTVNQKLVDKKVRELIFKAIQNNENIVINQTNLTVRGRKRFLSYFPNNYNKIAVVFPKHDLKILLQRNVARQISENKFIKPNILLEMIDRWEDCTINEGFNKIINL